MVGTLSRKISHPRLASLSKIASLSLFEFVLNNGFYFENECYERMSNGKGEFKDRGRKRILPIKYTPDFIGKDYIIECKGRANESFPMRWKMFKLLVSIQFPNYKLFKPQNQNECDQVVKIILETIKV